MIKRRTPAYWTECRILSDIDWKIMIWSKRWQAGAERSAIQDQVGVVGTVQMTGWRRRRSGLPGWSSEWRGVTDGCAEGVRQVVVLVVERDYRQSLVGTSSTQVSKLKLENSTTLSSISIIIFNITMNKIKRVWCCEVLMLHCYVMLICYVMFAHSYSDKQSRVC